MVKVLYEPHHGAFYYGPKRKTDDVLVSEIHRVSTPNTLTTISMISY